jgi:7,8-dihydropterin-6-yl-methyl-4-(beta-D-ribofuranosyl)aminobenzene 5'-phosphate synthase
MTNNSWSPDPSIIDERAVVFNLKEKGLVIISGCAHAGIINTINYAKEITDINRIFAVLGGFHLAGRENEKRIKQTVEALKTADPKLVIPSHCTGWRAIKTIADSFPDGFIWNSVGNLYKF